MTCERSDLPQCQNCKHNERGGRLVKPLIHRVENKHGQVTKQICLTYRGKQ